MMVTSCGVSPKGIVLDGEASKNDLTSVLQPTSVCTETIFCDLFTFGQNLTAP